VSEDRKEPKVLRDCKAHKANEVLRELPVRKVRAALRVRRVCRAFRVSKASEVSRAFKDPLDHAAPWGLRV
jgi:hypothetical protein